MNGLHCSVQSIYHQDTSSERILVDAVKILSVANIESGEVKMCPSKR